MSSEEEFEFRTPPEAPVFTPTEEEFRDPLAYVEKIRSIVLKTGICKIKPPPSWQPPFSVDVDKFKFTPRVQRLKELEAKTRIKLNFQEQIAKFWELQGQSLEIPTFNQKVIDLYTLHKIVHEEGGMISVNVGKKWNLIASKMGYADVKQAGSILKHFYDTILYPFDVLQYAKTKFFKETQSNINDSVMQNMSVKVGRRGRRKIQDSGTSKENNDRRKNSKSSNSPAQQAILSSQDNVETRAKQLQHASSSRDDSKELRRLKFFGAGPKMAGYVRSPASSDRKPRTKRSKFEYYEVGEYICQICKRGNVEKSLIVCDGCDCCYHTFCLKPTIPEIPKGKWYCPKCIAQEVNKPMDAFGFEQANKEYTLYQFGEMADRFKSDYFKMPAHLVPTSVVEKKFWQIVSSIEEDVTVEYGADLHTMDHGSGFPTKFSQHSMPFDWKYVNSPWNLNNFSVLQDSVLRYINANISGIKVPWIYVGMCFATFCWHNEDHWSYSINYLHWGEPKTWYGVPGPEAERFEQAMKDAAPELFHSQPDLLHQLVTVMNPNILMDAGVPVYRTDQEAGEFVITFPRAYHCGFNQGYNFAEAVNFALPDWLAISRECIDHYSVWNRFCVFSHDELVCSMALKPERLTHPVAVATYKDMLKMIEAELLLRKTVYNAGIIRSLKVRFEFVSDDERQCEICKTTCFLSAVTCRTCYPKKVVCLRHYASLCQCELKSLIMEYRYSLTELDVMMKGVKKRVELTMSATTRLRNAFGQPGSCKIELSDLRSLLKTEENMKYPNSDFLNCIRKVIELTEECVGIANELLHTTSVRQGFEAKFKMSLIELEIFDEILLQLPCILEERQEIRKLFDKVRKLEKSAEALLENVLATSEELAKCIESIISLNIELPIFNNLVQKFLRVRWLKQVRNLQKDSQQVTVEVLQELVKSGRLLPSNSVIESELTNIHDLLIQAVQWNEKANNYLYVKPYQTIAKVKSLIKKGENIPVYFPNMFLLKNALRNAKEWTSELETIQKTCYKSKTYGFLDDYESLVTKGRDIPVQLDVLPQLIYYVRCGKTWKKKIAKAFLKNNCKFSFLEAICPRVDIGTDISKSKKPENEDIIRQIFISAYEGKDVILELDKIVSAFQAAGNREIEAMKLLRNKNRQKRAGDSKYCLCRGGWYGAMLQCELCKDWFHTDCISITKTVSSESKLNTYGETQQLTISLPSDFKFLCPCCLRTKRPPLKAILVLLVSLLYVPVRLREREALQCLIERVLNWRNRAKKALRLPETANVLAKLTPQNKNPKEGTERRKTETVSNQMKKVENKPELYNVEGISPLPVTTNENILQSAFNFHQFSEIVYIDLELTSSERDDACCSDRNCEILSTNSTVSEKPSLPSSKNNCSGSLNFHTSHNSSEYAASKPVSTERIQQPLSVPCDPVLALSETMIEELEELMMEGDLLEVGLDEPYQIWRILQAVKPRQKEKMSDFPQAIEITESSRCDEEEKKAKKRKLEECNKRSLKTRSISKEDMHSKKVRGNSE